MVEGSLVEAVEDQEADEVQVAAAEVVAAAVEGVVQEAARM